MAILLMEIVEPRKKLAEFSQKGMTIRRRYQYQMQPVRIVKLS
jgi:hypothetical protein